MSQIRSTPLHLHLTRVGLHRGLAKDTHTSPVTNTYDPTQPPSNHTDTLTSLFYVINPLAAWGIVAQVGISHKTTIDVEIFSHSFIQNSAYFEGFWLMCLHALKILFVAYFVCVPVIFLHLLWSEQ